MAIPKAREAISRYAVTLRPDAPILQAVDVLVAKRAAGAPVVNEDGVLVGVLTEKDCLRLLSSVTWGEISGGQVGDFMSESPLVIDAEQSLFEAAKAFLSTNFPVLPVVEQGKLVGRMARQDLLARLFSFSQRIEKECGRRQKQLRRKGGQEATLAQLDDSTAPEELASLLDRL